jgi:hypothetical protein
MTAPLSATTICNMALTRIGSTQLITSLADQTNEGFQATLWYDQSREALLRDFAWPWSMKYGQLAQVSTTGTPPNAEWQYSYRYPTDCLLVRRLTGTPTAPTSPPLTTLPTTFLNDPSPWLREDGDAYPVPFEIGHDDDGRLIYTDLYLASIKYVADVSDPTQFSNDFASLLAWRIAVEFAYGLAISDTRRKVAQEMYENELMKARAQALNEAQRDQPYVDYNSEFVRARFGG